MGVVDGGVVELMVVSALSVVVVTLDPSVVEKPVVVDVNLIVVFSLSGVI